MSGFEIPKEKGTTNATGMFGKQSERMNEIRAIKDSLYIKTQNITEKRNQLFKQMPKEVLDAYKTKQELETAKANLRAQQERAAEANEYSGEPIPEIQELQNKLDILETAIKGMNNTQIRTPEEKINDLENKLAQQLQQLSPKHKDLYNGLLRIDGYSQ